jgi:hypothetical protein
VFLSYPVVASSAGVAASTTAWVRTGLLVACLATPRSSWSQGSDGAAIERAVALADQADAMFQRGEFGRALDTFRKARNLSDAPTFRLREAECLEKLGRWTEAVQMYARTGGMALDHNASEPFRQAVQRAGRQGQALQARLSRVSVVVDGADLDTVAVFIDGVPVPRAYWLSGWFVFPGEHTVATRKGASQTSTRILGHEGYSTRVNMHLNASGDARDAGETEGSASVDESRTTGGELQRTSGWISVGVGVAGLATWGITSYLAYQSKAKLNDHHSCEDHKCYSSASDDVNTYMNLRTASGVGFYLGLVGVGAGALLLLSAPSAPAPGTAARVRPWLGLGAAGLDGIF